MPSGFVPASPTRAPSPIIVISSPSIVFASEVVVWSRIVPSRRVVDPVVRIISVGIIPTQVIIVRVIIIDVPHISREIVAEIVFASVSHVVK